MPVAVQHQIRPDFVGNHHAVVAAEHVHRLLDLPTLPHTAARIVRAAEHRHMDVVLLQAPIHIVEIHTPHALFVTCERAVLDSVSGVFQCHGEPHVSGAVQQNLVSRSRKRRHRGHQATKHAVFVADRFTRHVGDAIAITLPVGDGVEIVVAHLEIPERRMLRTFDNRLRDGGDCGEVHVSDPHGDGIKPQFWRIRRKPGHGTQAVDGECILAVPFHNRSEIVGHCGFSLTGDAARIWAWLLQLCCCIR